MDKDAIESSIIIDLFKEEYKLDFEALNLQWIKKYFRVEEEDRFALKRSGPDVGGETGFSFSPLNGVVSDGFDLSNGHLGIDIVAAEGELIHSVDDGVVLISTYTAENGYVVVVQHGNSRTSVYKHNSMQDQQSLRGC